LIDYTKYHFSGEEGLLEKTNYPALSSHRLQHQEFTKRVEDFQRSLAAGKGGESIVIAEFMNNWLLGHIKQTDQKYSAHLNANGVS
jgi:hemerythrin